MNALHRFERIIESLKPENDYYCLNLDFDAYCSPSSCCLQRLTRGGRYCKALAAVDAAYADRACWAKKSILNVCRRSVLPRLPSIPSSDSYFRYSLQRPFLQRSHHQTVRARVQLCRISVVDDVCLQVRGEGVEHTTVQIGRGCCLRRLKTCCNHVVLGALHICIIVN